VHWAHAHALALYPLPHAMVLADASAPPGMLEHEGCRTFNPVGCVLLVLCMCGKWRGVAAVGWMGGERGDDVSTHITQPHTHTHVRNCAQGCLPERCFAAYLPIQDELEPSALPGAAPDDVEDGEQLEQQQQGGSDD
jgi:hypothetical protein